MKEENMKTEEQHIEYSGYCSEPKTVEALKKLLIQMSLELNLTAVGSSNLQKLIREIEDIVSMFDPEIGAKLKIANKETYMD